MAYFPDLSPYSYGTRRHEGVVHIGWLDNTHPFPRGSVSRSLIEKIKSLAANPVERYRGYHLCELCIEPAGLRKTLLPDRVVIDPSCEWAQWTTARRSDSEIRVVGRDVTYAAPVLIVHYIESHNYLPPAQFLEAVEAVKD